MAELGSVSALEALKQLKAGNARFVRGSEGLDHYLDQTRPKDVKDGQNPFAIVLGCSDSRVPLEIILDQGLGDLFVIRVAGNVVAPSQIGSIEYAAEQFGTRLVVVLGHSECGAVNATLSELKRPAEVQSPNLHSIVERIQPAVESLLAEESGGDPETLLQRAVVANIHRSVEQLRHGSEILEGLVAKGDLLIVGAVYSLETGEVEFFD